MFSRERHQASHVSCSMSVSCVGRLLRRQNPSLWEKSPKSADRADPFSFELTACVRDATSVMCLSFLSGFLDPLFMSDRSVPSLGRAPMLVYVRPSNEALLRARVLGAQDQCGCPSNPFYRGGSASKKGTWPPPSPSCKTAPLPPTTSHVHSLRCDQYWHRPRRRHAGVQAGAVGEENSVAGTSRLSAA